MHVDSRNPIIYISGLKCTDTHGNKFAFRNLYGYEVTEIGIQKINHTMYIDYCDIEAYDFQYVKRSDYDVLKAKLDNIERKYAKLKRRHDNLGGKYLVVKEERNYLIDVNGYKREDFTE
jgi:hypothetical protein